MIVVHCGLIFQNLIELRVFNQTYQIEPLCFAHNGFKSVLLYMHVWAQSIVAYHSWLLFCDPTW